LVSDLARGKSTERGGVRGWRMLKKQKKYNSNAEGLCASRGRGGRGERQGNLLTRGEGVWRRKEKTAMGLTSGRGSEGE